MPFPSDVILWATLKAHRACNPFKHLLQWVNSPERHLKGLKSLNCLTSTTEKIWFFFLIFWAWPFWITQNAQKCLAERISKNTYKVSFFVSCLFACLLGFSWKHIPTSLGPSKSVLPNQTGSSSPESQAEVFHVGLLLDLLTGDTQWYHREGLSHSPSLGMLNY